MVQIPGEFQIPPGEYNQIPEAPIYDEVAFAYETVQPIGPDSPLYFQERAKQSLLAEIDRRDRQQVIERAANIESARQYAIDSTLFVLGKNQSSARISKAIQMLIGGADKLPSFAAPKDLTHRELIQRESIIGSEVLGTPEHGGERTFFYSDAKEWVWHEASADLAKSVTTRYMVEDKGVLKIQDGAPQYEYIGGVELERFVRAVEVYHSHVMARVYKRDNQTDYNLAA